MAIGVPSPERLRLRPLAVLPRRPAVRRQRLATAALLLHPRALRLPQAQVVPQLHRAVLQLPQAQAVHPLPRKGRLPQRLSEALQQVQADEPAMSVGSGEPSLK